MIDDYDPFAGFPTDDYEEDYGVGTSQSLPHDFWQSFDTIMAAAKMGVQHDTYTKILGEYRNLGVATPRENDIERYVSGRLEYETQQQGNDVYVGRGQFYQSTSMIAPPALSQAYTQMAQYGVSRQELDVTLTRHFGPEFLVNPDPAKIQQAVQQEFGGWINQPGYDEANRLRNPTEMRYTQPGQIARLYGRQKDVTNILKTERRDVLHRGEGSVFSAQSFIGSSMAPAGTQPGTTTGIYDPSDPNSAAKIAKQLQRNAAVYKQPDIFRGGENITVRSPMFEVENQPLMGFKGNVAFLLGADINPEGMSRNVVDPNLQASTRFTRTFDVERGRKFNFREIGTTWNVGAGERVVPFEGANPLRLKGGGSVSLVDVVHGTRQRTNRAGKSYTVSTVTPIFERVQDLQDIHAQEKTGASKTVMGFYSQQQMQQWYSPQALRQQYESTGNEEFLRMAKQAEEIEATTGVAPSQYSYNYGKYMENLPGMYWSTRLEEAGQVLGKTRSEMADWRWGDNPEENRKLYEHFYAEIAPQHTRQVRHPIDVHESNLGMYSEIEEPGMRQELGGGMYRLYTKPVETLYMADMMRVIRGQGGGSSEYIPEEVMNLMQHEIPEQAAFFEQRGRFHRERAQELRSAALANTGEYEPSEHRQIVTQEMAQSVLTRAQQTLFEETSYTDTADVPDAVMTNMITRAAAEQEWGRNQLDWGFGTTGVSPKAIEHLMTGGPAENEEFGRIASLQARMFQAVAAGSGKISDLAPTFAEEQEQLARSQMVERSLSGSFATGASRYSVLGISEDIAANEIVLPDDMFLQSIGGTDLEGEARATALGGTIPVLADRAPTLRGEQYGASSFFMGISQTAYMARGGQLINPSSVLTSSEGAQALGRSDADGDYIRSMIASNLARLDKKTGQLEVRFPEGWRYAKPEEVVARGKMLEIEGQRGSNRREMEAANRMEKYQLGNLREYGPQELNLATRINSQMKMTMGADYNVLKLVEATAGEKSFESAFQLFSNVYGIEQTPKELSKYGRRMMDIMGRSSAKWMPVGDNAQNRGYAGAYQEMVRSALLAPEVTEGVLGAFVPAESLEMAQQALPDIRALVSEGKMGKAQSAAADVLSSILEQSGTYEQAGMQTAAGVALAGTVYGAEEEKKRDPSKTMGGLTDEQLMLARDVSRLKQLIKKPVSRDEEDNVARLSTLEQQQRYEEAHSIAQATGIEIGVARMAPLEGVGARPHAESAIDRLVSSIVTEETTIAAMAAAPISAQNLGDLMTVEEIEAFGQTEAANTPTPTVSAMGAGGGRGSGIGGGVVAAAAGGGGGGDDDWKKRKAKLASEIKRFVEGKTVNRVVGGFGNKALYGKYSAGLDESAIENINLAMNMPNADKILEVARKVAAGEELTTREEVDLMPRAKDLINDISKVSGSVSQMGTFYRTSIAEAESIAAKMPEADRAGYMAEVTSALGGYSEQDIMNAPALAHVAGVLEDIGIETSDIDKWKRQYTTIKRKAEYSGVAKQPRSGVQYADVLRGMYEGDLQFGSSLEAKQYAISQGLSNAQVAAVTGLAGGKGLTEAQETEALRADPGLSQYLKQSGNYEKELQEVTKSLIEARKDLAQNTKGMSKTEKEALDNILVGKAKTDATRVLGEAYATEGIGGQARIMGTAAYKGFIEEAGIGAEDRFSGMAAMRGVKALFSPFSPTGAMIKAVWRMGVGQAGEDAEAAAQLSMRQMLTGAQAGGLVDQGFGEGTPVTSIIQRQAAMRDSRTNAAYAFEQTWGWARGQGGMAVPRAVLGPALGAGAAVGIGLSHLAGIKGMGAVGTAMGAAALPLGLAVAGIGSAIGMTNYGIGASERTPWNVSSAFNEWESMGRRSSAFDMGGGISDIGRLFGMTLRDIGGTITQPFRDEGIITLGGGRFDTNTGRLSLGGTSALMTAQQTAMFDQDFSSLDYSQRHGLVSATAGRLRRTNDVFANFDNDQMMAAINELYSYTGTEPGDLTRNSRNTPGYQDLLAAQMTGNIDWQQATGLSQIMGGGLAGAQRVATSTMHMDAMGRGNQNLAYQQFSGLRQFGIGFDTIMGISQDMGAQTGQDEINLQRLLSNDQRTISRLVSGDLSMGGPFDQLRGQWGLATQDNMGFRLGQMGGMSQLAAGTSREVWSAIGSNPLARMMGMGVNMKSALMGTVGQSSFLSSWNGDSYTDAQIQYANFQRGQENQQFAMQERQFTNQYGNIGASIASLDDVGGWFGRSRQLDQQSRDLSRASTRVGFGFQAAGAAMNYSHFMQNWQLQGQQMRVGRDWQLQGFEWQREDMGIGRERGLVQRGWQVSDLDTGYGRAGTRFGWQEQDMLRSREQMQTANQFNQWNVGWQQRVTGMQRGWQEQDWEWSEQQRQQSYGWNLEDINENIRFASGRQRKQLLKQRDRMTITQAQGEERADTEEERAREMWRMEDERFNKQKENMEQERNIQEENWQIQFERLQTQRQWTDEDYSRDRERMQQKNQWDDEDYQKQSERFDATVEYQNTIYELQKQGYELSLEQMKESHGLQQAQLAENIASYETQIALEDERLRLQDEISKQQIEDAKTILDMQREAKDARQAFELIGSTFSLLSDANMTQALSKLEKVLDKILGQQNTPGWSSYNDSGAYP